MKKLLIALCLVLAAGSAFAKDEASADAKPKKELTPQQQRMQNCNKEAKEQALKGPERKQFMSGCLKGSGKPTEAKK